jgi:hypothetical protein
MQEPICKAMLPGCSPVPSESEPPRPEWVRGRCPLCGDFVVSNTYYVDGRGYLIAWECAASLSEPATCDYRRIL